MNELIEILKVNAGPFAQIAWMTIYVMGMLISHRGLKNDSIIQVINGGATMIASALMLIAFK